MTVTNTKTNTVKALACQALKSIGSCRHCHVMQSFHLNCFISPLLHCMPDAAVLYPIISVHYTVFPFTEIVSENGTVHCDWITAYQHSDSEFNPSKLVKFIKLKKGLSSTVAAAHRTHHTMLSTGACCSCTGSVIVTAHYVWTIISCNSFLCIYCKKLSLLILPTPSLRVQLHKTVMKDCPYLNL